MKIIVAPSKTQKIRSLEEFCECELQLSNEKFDLMKKQSKTTNKLVKVINSHSKETIAKKMKLKGKLLDEVVYNYKNFKKTEEGHGILSYTGTVFKELEFQEYGYEEFSYMNDHLVILSALYGPLAAFYPIKPYRLDMTMTLFQQNLYKEWQSASEKWFKDEDIIIDLSSKEFSKMVNGKKLTFDFIQIVNGEHKAIAYHSKLARGLMLNFLIKNQITDIEDIKKFDVIDYSFDNKASSESNYVFSKKLTLI